MKVASLFGLLEQLESDKIAVDQDRCVLVRNRNAECLRCAEACASGCIAFDGEENRVVISPEKCIGCGTCATVCPTCALEAQNPDDRAFLASLAAAAQANGGHAVVACDQMLVRAEGRYDPARVVEVPCLGRVEESVLLSLAAMGAKRVTLVHGPCDQCEYHCGFSTASLVTETARTLLDLWESAMELRISAKLPASVRREEAPDHDEGRRAFFTSARDETRRAAAMAGDMALREALGEKEPEETEEPSYRKVQADGTLAHYVPPRRLRTLAALRRLGEPEDVMVGTRLWGHVIIDADTCSSCQMCTVFCPTGALERFSRAGGTFGVSHAPSACVKCRCCEEICPEGAISISDEIFAVDLLRGEVERYEMRPREVQPGHPHQIHQAMKKLVGIEQFYER